LKNIYQLTKPIGILGVGSFGTVLANIIAKKYNVLVYARKESSLEEINLKKTHRGITIHPNVTATNDIHQIAKQCDIIFPVVPSYAFKAVLHEILPSLTSNHILIHGTKGFSVEKNLDDKHVKIYPNDISTMSQLIVNETPVYRVGCISGPNLSKEIAKGQPAATVIASKYKEVIDIGKSILHNDLFQVFGSFDIRGIEMAGIFKNYIAIAAGASAGIGLGENVKALLITRGIAEMIEIGNFLGVDSKSFLGLAGIGDLVATCNSPLSRNYTVGFQLAQGKTIEAVLETMTEAAEGLNTIKVIKHLSDTMHIQAPLVQIIYKVVYENYPLENGIKLLMRLNAGNDVSFIK
jgi:glycerol-3-phosphate dehydrogenase (NAD(P)+)